MLLIPPLAMVPARSLVFLVLALLAVQAVATTSISILLYDIGQTPNIRPARNVVVNDAGNTTTIPPTSLGTVTIPIALFDLANGDYEVTVSEDGYYRFKHAFTVGPTYDTNIIIWLVPVSYGVTFLTHPIENGGNVWPNMTFPQSAGFQFTHASLIPSYSGGNAAFNTYNFGAGTPPAQFLNLPWIYTLSAATAGTYRYYEEVLHYDPIPVHYPHGLDFGYNFTMTSATVSVFAGNTVDGFVGTYRSSSVLGKSWYVGDLVVTNPTLGCSHYQWQTVNTYNLSYGFDMTNHGSGVAILDECFDVSPAALECANFVYDDSSVTSTCGAFGDPHLKMFNGTEVTCGMDARLTLVDNDYFSLIADTQLLVDTSNATVISRMTFKYKLACNPTSVVFDDVASIQSSAMNYPLAYRHTLRVVGNNIYVDALHLRVQVRLVSGAVVFGVSMPNALIALSTGACVNSCPAGTQLPTAKRDSTNQAVFDACAAAGLTVGTFEYTSCVFDVTTTGNTNYAAGAATFLTVTSELSTPWRSASTVPTSEVPHLLPSYLAILLLATLCFLL